MKKYQLIITTSFLLQINNACAYGPLSLSYADAFNADELYSQTGLPTSPQPRYEEEAKERLYALKEAMIEKKLEQCLGKKLKDCQRRLESYIPQLTARGIIGMMQGVSSLAGASFNFMPSTLDVGSGIKHFADGLANIANHVVDIASGEDSIQFIALHKEIEDVRSEIDAYRTGIYTESIKNEEEFYVTHKKDIHPSLQKSIEDAFMKARTLGPSFSNPREFIRMALNLPRTHKNLLTERSWALIQEEYNSNDFFNRFSEEVKSKIFNTLIKQAYFDSGELQPPSLRQSYYFWGNAGVGKTEAAKQAARFLSFPCHEINIRDTTSLSDKEFSGMSWLTPMGTPGWFADVFLKNGDKSSLKSVLIINEFDRLLVGGQNSPALSFLLNLLDPRKTEIFNNFFGCTLNISHLIIILTANKNIPLDEAHAALRSRFGAEGENILHFPDFTNERARPHLITQCEDYMRRYYTLSEQSVEEIVDEILVESTSGSMRAWEIALNAKVLSLPSDPNAHQIIEVQSEPDTDSDKLQTTVIDHLVPQDPIPGSVGFQEGFNLRGKYKIYCDTQHKGRRYLEAFPKTDIARSKAESSHQDQIWTIKNTDTNGYYTISCNTRNEGKRFLEAFPRSDEVKLKFKSSTQDQRWLINRIDDYYHIRCITHYGGTRYLEAFPRLDLVKPRPASMSQDQRWRLERAN